MPANPKRSGTGASNSFTRAEVDAGRELFRLLLRGGDTSIVVRSPVFRKLVAKFDKMWRSIEEGRSGIGGTPDGG